MRGVVLCKSRDVEIVQDAGGVFNTARKENGGVGRKKTEWRCRQEEGIYILEFLQFDSYPACCWLKHNTAQSSSCTTTKHLMNEEPRDKI